MAWGVRSVRNLISTQAYTGHFLTRAERGGTSCDAVWIGTACVLTDRDGVRAYGSGRRATRCGPGATGGDTDFYGRLRVRLEA